MTRQVSKREPVKANQIPDGTPIRLIEAPGYLARRLYQAYIAIWVRTVDATLTGPQFAVLVAVSEYPGVDQGSLASSVALDRSTMADIARRLEERGLLQRDPDAADARRKLLSLTAEGREVLRGADARARELDKRLMGNRSAAEQTAVLQMLQDLSADWVDLSEDL